MAYRYEGNELIIDGWERGISSGPYSIFSPSALGPINQTGMVDLSYVNITGVPGEVSVNFPMTAGTIAGSPPKSGGQFEQITTKIVGATVSKYYTIDSYGQIFTSDGTLSGGALTWTYQNHVGSNASSITNANGIVWWQSYLLAIRTNAIYYSSDDGANWTDWTSVVGALLASSGHYMISSKVSDRVYFCNGSGVGAVLLTQRQTFDPTNTATFTFNGGTNPNMVSIPSYDDAFSLGELNGQILIGGGLNRVYPWDAANLAGTGITSLVGLPLFLGDRYVQRIVVVNSNAYIFAGSPTIASGRGYIYVSNGSQIDVFAKMPDNFTSIGGSVSDINTPYWRFFDAMWHRNQLVFGAVALTNNTSSQISDTGGIWAIDIGSQALYRMTDTSSATALVPMDTGTSIPGLGIVAGTASGTFFNSTSTMSTAGRIISDKIPVGTRFIPKTFEQLELKLAVALVSGESIAVTVITDVNPSGLSVGSMTSSDGMSKVFSPLNFQAVQWLQVKCVLTPTNTNPTFVRVRDIRLR